MDLKRNIEKKYKENILNLSKKELSFYIKQLAKEYYSYFFSNDSLAFESTVNNFKLLESIGAGANIKEFVNYCLLYEINRILNEKVNPEITLEAFVFELNEVELPEGLVWKEPPFENDRIRKIWTSISWLQVDYNEKLYELKKEIEQLQKDKKQLLEIAYSKELDSSEAEIVNRIESYENLNLNKFDFNLDVMDLFKDID